MCCELQSCSLWSLRHRLSHMEMKQCSNSMAVPTTIANIPLLPHTLANRSAFFFALFSVRISKALQELGCTPWASK